MRSTIRQLIVVNLVLLSWAFAGSAIYAWTHGKSIAQSVLTTLQINGVNGLGNSSQSWSFGINCNTDNTIMTFGFPASNCEQATLNWLNGDYSYGGGSSNKSSPSLVSNVMNKYGGAQAVLNNNTMNCFGVGDCGVRSDQVYCAGYSINGDETSCGFSVVQNVQQQFDINNLQQSVTSVAKTTCNTTITQSITDASAPAAITFTVASTTGCNVGDWVVLGQELPAESPNVSAVQITAVGVGTISAVVRENYSNGATVTPAVVLNLPSGYAIGQGRYLINHSATSYSTGTAAGSASNGIVTGSGTAWTTGIVGGSATNIGCIAFDGDDYDAQNSRGGAQITGATITGTALAYSAKAPNANVAVGQRVVGSGVTAGTVIAAGSSATVTMTIASPAVVTWTGSNFTANQPISFTTTGVLPTGVTAGTTYYVIAAGLTANSFEFSTTVGGGAVTTSGVQGGTHTGSSWTVSPSQTESTPETMFTSPPAASGSWSISGTTLTASTSGLAVGQTLYGAGVIDGTMIVGGSSGAWTLNVNNGTISSEPMAASYTMRSWYQINGVTNNTSLGIIITTPFGAVAYGGLQTSQGKYLIRPCARILYVIDSHHVALENTSVTWNANDFVEQPVVPYMDMAGLLYRVLTWEPGSPLANPFMSVLNAGARTWPGGISFGPSLSPGSNADTIAWTTAFSASSVHHGLSISNSDTDAIQLNTAFGGDVYGDTSGKIVWNGSGINITPNSTNCGLDHQLTMTGIGGKLAATAYNSATACPPQVANPLGTGTSSGLQWQGVLGTTATTFSALPTCVSGLEGYERAITDGNSTTFNGTVAGGGANHVKAYCNGSNWTVH